MFSNKTWISEYYNTVSDEIQKEVSAQTGRDILSLNAESYAESLFDKYSLPEIIFDKDRNPDISKTRPEGYLWIHIRLPVIANDKISKVLELQPNAFTRNPPPMEYYNGYISTEAPADTTDVKKRINDVKQEVKWRNDDIQRLNKELKGKISQIIDSRIKQVKDEDSILEKISKEVSIPLKQKAKLSSVIPILLKVKKKIQPIIAPEPKQQTEYRLEREKFKAVLELVDNCCQMFERTPTTFSKLDEEDLRNVILSSLNGVFEGGAVGEAFSKFGKTDIYLKIEKGNIFIAECKYWKGPKTLDEAVNQILGYLTWRNSYGVVIVFSKNKGFSDVVEALSKLITKFPYYVEGLEQIEETHFKAFHHLPEDKKKLIEMHYIVYNLYGEKPK